MEAGHEVDDNVVGEDAESRERQVGEQVGNRERGAAVHAVAGLKAPVDQDNG